MKKSVFALLISSLLLASSTFASTENSIRAALIHHNANIEINSIKPSQIKGLYEVVYAKNNIIYVDAKAKHVLDGNLIRIKDNHNFTEEKASKLLKIEWSSLKMDDSFAIKKGDGSREFAIFSDTDCQYCIAFEKMLEGVDNYTMHVFLLSFNQESAKHAMSIWCADSREKAWHDWMLHRQNSEEKEDCANPLEHNLKNGHALGIRGTPTIVRKDGRVTNGVKNAEKFNEFLK